MLYLENAIKLFASATNTFGEDCNAEIFYHQLAKMIPDTVDVDTLLLAIKIALKDSAIKGEETLGFIALIPQYVQQCASLEFAHEFRQKYIKDILGIDQDEIPDVDYGLIEIEKGIIDISHKDIADVIAALYNASCPIGNGFFQYNPVSWDRDIANMYLEKYKNEITLKDGSICIKYILGRPMHIIIENNLIYINGYNADNEPGLAERVIRSIPDKEKKKTL